MAKPNDYPLFNHWFQVLIWLMDRSESMDKKLRFTLSQRIVSHGLEVAVLIVEAIYEKERIPLLRSINKNLEVLRVLIRLAYFRKQLSAKQYEYAAKQIDIAGRMVGGWMKT